MINKRKIALLYYTIIDAIDYDIENKDLLKMLDSRFSNTPSINKKTNTPSINKEILLQAIAMYNELLAKEFETLVTKKCNGDI